MTRHFFTMAICFTALCDGYTTFYGPDGQLAGSANTIAGFTTYNNAQGVLVGTSNSVGGYTTFYDTQSGYAGSANSVSPLGTGGLE